MFRGLYGDIWIEDMLSNLPGGQKSALLMVANLTIFVLGFFIDFFEIAFIISRCWHPCWCDSSPAPSGCWASRRSIDARRATWFGVMIAMNLQTSFLTPPFGFALFYLKGVCTRGREDHGDLQGRAAVHHSGHGADPDLRLPQCGDLAARLSYPAW